MNPRHPSRLRCRTRMLFRWFKPALVLMAGFSLAAEVSAASAARQTTGVQSPADLSLPKIDGVRPRNVIVILIDDQRYDAMGFMGHPFLKTPNMDRMAKGGVNFTAAYVTTSLCSPSRASILTGQYAHHHRVVDNNNPVQKGTVFFPQYLQAAGYETGFFGKWHMGGGSDAPRPGFDRWVSFRGQGSYLPSRNGLNVDGKKVPQKGYITDELTDYCVDWIRRQDGTKPFFAYLSHKAAHAMFVPAKRHAGRYKNAKVIPPRTQADTPENNRGKPRWVRDQRNSWHGVDFPYHGELNVATFYRQYCEVLLGVDDSLGRVMDALKKKGMLESTLILYMGDNGFCFGEHGLIDKRQAYEASMRIPLMAHCPELLKAGSTVKQVVANIDIAPTILHAAGLKTPSTMDGRSFLTLAQGKPVSWRKSLLYEYYWERNFPQTPTMHALRTDRYKYIHYYGIWDIDELYDIQKDPDELHNLVFDPAHKQDVKRLNRMLFDRLSKTGGMYIPLNPDRGRQQNRRNKNGQKAADFPPQLFRKK